MKYPMTHYYFKISGTLPTTIARRFSLRTSKNSGAKLHIVETSLTCHQRSETWLVNDTCKIDWCILYVMGSGLSVLVNDAKMAIVTPIALFA